jgi:aspartate/methionine/tyrosine aminotransferase
MTLESGTLVPYYLNESEGWSAKGDEIIKSIKEARDAGTVIRAMVVINPGNPTGQVLKRSDLEDIVKICYEENIMLVADQVYQENIYKEGLEFLSLKKVMYDLGEPYWSDVELISMHSVSKGLLGECGLRGGYAECVNFSDRAKAMMYKLKSINLCSNTIG